MQFDWLLPKTFKLLWLSNRLSMSVLDDGYSRHASCTLNAFDIYVFIKVVCTQTTVVSVKIRLNITSHNEKQQIPHCRNSSKMQIEKIVERGKIP